MRFKPRKCSLQTFASFWLKTVKKVITKLWKIFLEHYEIADEKVEFLS